MASVRETSARGGTLVLGGGFAGAYVARLLGKRGATIVVAAELDAVHAAPARGGVGHDRAAPRRCAVAPDVPPCRAGPRPATVLDLDDGAVAPTPSPAPSRSATTPRRRPRRDHASSPSRPRRARTGFKDLADAIALRNHVLQRLDAAAAGGPGPSSAFVFVGAGYAGVEAPGELNDLVHAALRYYPSLRDVPQRWVLVEAAPKILAEIPPGSARTRRSELERRGIEIRVGDDARLLRRRDRRSLGRHGVPARTSSGQPG